MVENSPDLRFVELEEIFRSIGKPPDWAISQGYNPKTDRQVAIFGDEQELAKWRDEKGLDPEQYPVHQAKMDTHIDVYGVEAIKTVVPEDGIISTREYHAGLSEVGG